MEPTTTFQSEMKKLTLEERRSYVRDHHELKAEQLRSLLLIEDERCITIKDSNNFHGDDILYLMKIPDSLYYRREKEIEDLVSNIREILEYDHYINIARLSYEAQELAVQRVDEMYVVTMTDKMLSNMIKVVKKIILPESLRNSTFNLCPCEFTECRYLRKGSLLAEIYPLYFCRYSPQFKMEELSIKKDTILQDEMKKLTLEERRSYVRDHPELEEHLRRSILLIDKDERYIVLTDNSADGLFRIRIPDSLYQRKKEEIENFFDGMKVYFDKRYWRSWKIVQLSESSEGLLEIMFDKMRTVTMTDDMLHDLNSVAEEVKANPERSWEDTDKVLSCERGRDCKTFGHGTVLGEICPMCFCFNMF